MNNLSSLIVPVTFAVLGVGVWIGGNLLGDRIGGSNLATQLVTLAAAAWQRKGDESTVKTGNVETLEVQSKD